MCLIPPRTAVFFLLIRAALRFFPSAGELRLLHLHELHKGAAPLKRGLCAIWEDLTKHTKGEKRRAASSAKKRGAFLRGGGLISTGYTLLTGGTTQKIHWTTQKIHWTTQRAAGGHFFHGLGQAAFLPHLLRDGLHLHIPNGGAPLLLNGLHLHGG